MVVTEKMKKEVVQMMKDSEDKDLNKSYKFIEELPLESFKRVVKILNGNMVKLKKKKKMSIEEAERITGGLDLWGQSENFTPTGEK